MSEIFTPTAVRAGRVCGSLDPNRPHEVIRLALKKHGVVRRWLGPKIRRHLEVSVCDIESGEPPTQGY